MRFSRLFVLSLVFTGSSLSAQAQYTSRSPVSAETAAKKTETTAPAPAAKTNPYTGTGAAPAAQAAKPQQQPAQPVFRPRPQPAAMPQTAGDDELPSFDALEKPTAAAQGSAQGSNLPPPPPPTSFLYLQGLCTAISLATTPTSPLGEVLSLSPVGGLFCYPWTIACQVFLSMGFPRQEQWSGLLFPSPGDLPNSGIQPVFLALAGGFFISEPSGKPHLSLGYVLTHP